MLNKNKPFAEHLGELTENVKFSQDGHGFDAGGKLLGKFVDGKLSKVRRKPTKPAADADADATPDEL